MMDLDQWYSRCGRSFNYIIYVKRKCEQIWTLPKAATVLWHYANQCVFVLKVNNIEVVWQSLYCVEEN
jgi:hypothetical protein